MSRDQQWVTSKRPHGGRLPVFFVSLSVHAVAFLLLNAFYGIPRPGTRPTDIEPGIAITPSQRVTFLRVHPGGSPAPDGARRVPGYPMARRLPNVLPHSGASEGDKSSSDLNRAVRPSLVIMPPPRGLSGLPTRTRQVILDSALKDWSAEAERTRQVENQGPFGVWIATIDGRKYGLEPGWLRAGTFSVPLPPVYFLPEPYAYERQRDAAWQRQDMRRQIRQRLIDSAVTAAAVRLRTATARARDGAPR